jgi:hypothetical protein
MHGLISGTFMIPDWMFHSRADVSRGKELSRVPLAVEDP